MGKMKEHKDLEMPDDLHLKSLKLVRELIASGEELIYYDDTTVGNKHTECSWGLCTDSKVAYPDPEMHLWPDQFTNSNRVAPKYRKKHQKCPFDIRDPDKITMNGCFWTCWVFQRKHRKGRILKEYVLQLFDKEIERFELFMKGDSEFKIYSHGPLYMSVCTSLSPEEATIRANKDNPTEIDSQWRIHTGEFRNGEPNPCPCNDHPETHKHYLFVC
jgi:hypothetical protein